MIHMLWFNYFWPSLKGNGPEALVQTLVYGAVAMIFVPILRRFAKAEAQKLHEKIDHSHELMRHLIKHSPNVPDFEE